jgi:hypothetical protein
MNHPIPTSKKIVAGAVALGALSLGTAGLAWSAPTAAPVVPRSARHFECANATKDLTRIARLQADVAAGLPKLNAAAAKAQAHGHTERADRLKKRIARFEGARYKKRLARTASAIEAKCHVPAPGPTTALGTGTGSVAQS